MEKTKKCPHCIKDVNRSLKICPHCNKKMSLWSAWVIILVAGVSVLMIIIMVMSSSGSFNKSKSIAEENKAVGHDNIGVCVEAQMQLKNYLKSPSTAEFPSCSNFSIQKQENDTFIVSSYVDSQNGFGATIRSNWTMKYHYLGEGQIFIDSLILDGDKIK